MCGGAGERDAIFLADGRVVLCVANTFISSGAFLVVSLLCLYRPETYYFCHFLNLIIHLPPPHLLSLLLQFGSIIGRNTSDKCCFTYFALCVYSSLA